MRSHEERLAANRKSARDCRRKRNAKRDAEQAELAEVRVQNAKLQKRSETLECENDKLRERIAQLEETDAGATIKRLECEKMDVTNKLAKCTREKSIVKQQLALSNSERDSAMKELEEFMILGLSLFTN